MKQLRRLAKQLRTHFRMALVFGHLAIRLDQLSIFPARKALRGARGGVLQGERRADWRDCGRPAESEAQHCALGHGACVHVPVSHFLTLATVTHWCACEPRKPLESFRL